jgi:hypothetical protein
MYRTPLSSTSRTFSEVAGVPGVRPAATILRKLASIAWATGGAVGFPG